MRQICKYESFIKICGPIKWAYIHVHKVCRENHQLWLLDYSRDSPLY